MSDGGFYEMGFEARCNGQYGLAKTYLGMVGPDDPKHIDAQWQLALILGFEGDFDGSLASLQGIVNSHPNHVHARYDLGMTMMMLGMQDEACAQFREVLRQSPDHEKASQQMAWC